MKRLVRMLAAAAVTATAVPAFAHDGCDHEGVPQPVPMYGGGRYGDRYDRVDHREAWRRRELAELRQQYRALDAERDAFYARWGWHARKVARYERHYAAERARLDQRWYELSGPAYASRW